MTRRIFQSIPSTVHVQDTEVRKILWALKDSVERRLLRSTNEKAITRQDLLDLGLISQEQINTLEN